MATVARIFTVTWLAYAGFYLCRKNFSVILPALAESFPKDRLATLVFAYSLAYAIGQFLSGTLADRLGAKRVVVAGLLLTVLCNLGLAGAGLSLSGIALLAVLTLLQLVNGLAQSAGWPGLLKITAQWFDERRRGVWMAWWSTSLAIGGLASTLIATWFITGWPARQWPELGWALGAIGPAAILMVIAVIFAAVARERRDPAADLGVVSAWGPVLASPALRCIVVSYFCLKLMRYSFLFWLPLYMVEQLRYSVAEAGYSSSLFELVGFAGVPLAGYVSDHLLGGRRFPVGAAMMFGLALACLIFPALSGFSRVGNLVAISLVGILTFGPDTLMAGAATQDAATPETAATAGGFVNGVGSLGQVTSPLLVSAVVLWAGWDALFYVFTAVALLGGVALAGRWNAKVEIYHAA
ncbi:MAG: MFS transporter [Bryobacteraceae bacterium]|nr:MFS transporter [Bryobacteraceae bacterium]